MTSGISGGRQEGLMGGEDEGAVLIWASLLSEKYCGSETGQITSQRFMKARDTLSYCAHTELCSIEFAAVEIKAMNLGLRSQPAWNDSSFK